MDIKILTHDGLRLDVPYGPAETVLAAAEAAGFYLPSMCREGSCGLCAAQVIDGAYQMGPHSEAALPKGDGGVLLCRCQALSDLVVKVPVRDEQIGRHKVPERAAIIEAIEPAAAGTVALTLKLEVDDTHGAAADFVPGQFMEFTLPGTDIKRAYSLANLPNWDGRLEFIIRQVPGGRFSGWLADEAKVGQRLHLRGPLGHFGLNETSPRPRVMVGGGCGMAPILSMLRHMAEFADPTPVHLIYGANSETELLPPEVIDGLKTGVPQLDVTLAIWRPGPGWAGFTGTSSEALSAYLSADKRSPDIYVCGPPKMIDAVEAAARLGNVPPAQLFVERVQS